MSFDRDHSVWATRRRLLQGAGAIGVGMALPPVFSAKAQGAFDWKKFKGEKIEVSLVKSPRADFLINNQKEFEDLTGITVGAEAIPEQQHRQKQVIDFSSGRPAFDVTSTAWHVQKRLFAKGKWLEDLRPMIADPSLTAPDFDQADFLKSGIEYSTQIDGRIDSLPLNIDYFMLYWNKELFAAKGLTEPKTFTEMVAAAKTIHDPKNGVYGFVNRGVKNANVVTWTALMLGWGAETYDAKTQTLLTDTPEAIESAALFKMLNTELSPPGTIGFNWMESLAAFGQGKIGMWIDGVGWAPPLEDPTKSKMMGKVGYAVMPRGPKAHRVAVYGDGIGVASASKKKGPAWFYTQWAASKSVQARLLSDGLGSGVRATSYQAPNIKANKDWLNVMVESAKIAVPGLPQIVPVTEFRDVFGVALTNMFAGADPATELKKATAEFRPVLEKSEKA
jgi:multiple sugar transport system substrate-binding protein